MNIETLFEGQELSEDFKSSVKTLFETAVAEAAKTAAEQIVSEKEVAFAIERDELTEQMEQLKVSMAEDAQKYGDYIVAQHESQLDEMSAKYELYVEKYIDDQVVTKVDAFMTYVSEQWMEENKLAVEKGLRSEMVEGFLSGLHNLFSEHYVSVPEEKSDVIEEMAAKIDTLQAKLNDSISESITLKQEIRNADREQVINSLAEGLTESQKERFVRIAGDLSIDNIDEFKTKSEMIRESIAIQKDAQKESQTTRKPVGLIENLTSQYDTHPEMSSLLEGLNRLAPKR